MLRAALMVTLLVLIGVPVAAQSHGVSSLLDDDGVVVEAATGLALIARLDPEDDDVAAQLAEIETLLSATGRDTSDLTMAFVSPAEGATGAVGVVIEVAGADPAALRAIILASIRSEMAMPVQDDLVLGDRTLVRLQDEGSVVSAPPFHLYATGDAVWTIHGSESEVATFLDRLR